MKSRVCRTYFVHDCIWKQIFASNLPMATSNLHFLNNFDNTKASNTVLTKNYSNYIAESAKSCPTS